jgi:hypothetical protein
MKNKKHINPTRSKLTVLRQLCNLIPPHLVPKLARETGVEDQTRTFSSWSHVVALMHAQLTHSIGLNDVCDSLRLNSGPLSAIRGATPPSRNNFSHANRKRDSEMAEKLFWAVLEHLQEIKPGFGRGKGGHGLARRFRRAIHVVDSTTIQLVASCMDWAKHRRRKAAAKCHLRLNLQSFLPNFAIIDTAREHDAKRAREVCAGIFEGEIAIFDKAYMDFEHLKDLGTRGVWWVTRAKENLAVEVYRRFPVEKGSKVLRDEIITLKKGSPREPEFMRRVTALVEVDGEEREMTFLTNNLEWSPQTVADLYRCRWEIEVFFKQLKQTLQLADFLGHNANAVRWQVWIALLVYVLLRFQAYLSKWNHSFTRLFTLIRASIWKNLDLLSLLRCYGTAGGSWRMLSAPCQAYLPGFG